MNKYCYMGLTAMKKSKIAKTFLWGLGFILMISVFWKYILYGFDLYDNTLKWTVTNTILVSVAFIFLLGASQYDKITDLIISRFSKKTE